MMPSCQSLKRRLLAKWRRSTEGQDGGVLLLESLAFWAVDYTAARKGISKGEVLLDGTAYVSEGVSGKKG